MAPTDHDLRLPLHGIAADEVFPGSPGSADDETHAAASRTSDPPLVSLMITQRQRVQLRELGFSDESLRAMTPAEAHEHLGLTKSDP